MDPNRGCGMGGLETKHFDAPDETRPFEGKGQLEIFSVGGREVGRGMFEPGWRWSENVIAPGHTPRSWATNRV